MERKALMWQIIKNLSDCHETHLLAPIRASILHPREDRQTLQKHCLLSNNALLDRSLPVLGGVTPGQFQRPSITVSLLPVINLRPLREQLEQRKLHQVSAEKAIWRDAVIDFIRPSGATPLSFSTSYSQIEVMSVWDEWSDTTSCSRNVELMNRTNFHQIKIHLHEAQVHLADTFP